MNKIKFICISYIILITCLFLYSYTQVDLNLTLSRISLWQTIQKSFQYIGWFQRPLSTAIYVIIISLLTIFYGTFINLARKNQLTSKQFWQVLGISSFILLFAYNAFSYDLFNYMFDARVITYHHLSPYEFRALDFPKDPWIHFMRWTHRLYPYGPVWLWLTVPLSFLGFQVFLPTLFLFKGLAVGSFLGTVYFIGKIARRISPKNELLCQVFFALNPLVIIESLVSAHNDIVMIFFSVWSIYFIMNKQYIRSLLLLILSIGIKFATVLFLPIFGYIFFVHNQKKEVNWEKMFTIMAILMLVAVVIASIRTNFQPWYLLYIAPFAVLLSKKTHIFIAGVVGSFIILLEYVPYLYIGNWDVPVPSILSILTIGSVISSVIFTILHVSWQKNKSSLQ